jgi:gluconate 2-dehydrogenase gamma chain
MSENNTSRRNVLIQIAAGAAALGTVSEADAQHVHKETAAATPAGAAYKAKAFTAAEEKSLRLLAEIICPGAVSKGGAFEFIDLLASNNKDLKAIYTGGLAWLDRECEKRFEKAFTAATDAQRTEVLDLIAFRKNAETNPSLGPGIRFFDWVRRMAVDAYYTSAAGIRELGYKGNRGMSDFKVPQEAIDYAMKRAGLA